MGTLSTERLEWQQALIALLESLDLGGGLGGDTILPTRLSIINLVKIKLDELIPQGEGVIYNLETEPNVSDPLDLYINGLLDEAAKNVLQIAPLHMITPVSSSTVSGTPYTDTKTGYVVLPEDYLRLYSFKMTEWLKEVNVPIGIQSKLYQIQRNKYSRGGIAKPVVVLNNRKIGSTVSKILEYFSVLSAHTIDRFLYIAETAAEDLNNDLLEALTWQCAGKILQNIKEFEQSREAYSRAVDSFTNL